MVTARANFFFQSRKWKIEKSIWPSFSFLPSNLNSFSGQKGISENLNFLLKFILARSAVHPVLLFFFPKKLLKTIKFSIKRVSKVAQMGNDEQVWISKMQNALWATFRRLWIPDMFIFTLGCTWEDSPGKSIHCH